MEAATKRERKGKGKRGNGEGTVCQRADGRWMGAITVGKTEGGRPVRRTVYAATKREVVEKLGKLRSQRMTGTLPSSDRMTVADFLNRWLNDVAKQRIRESTFHAYKLIIDRHILPRIGGVAVSRLSPVFVQELYSALERDGRSPRVRQFVHAVLHRALRQAVKWGLLIRNVCGDGLVETPKVKRKEMKTWDATQTEQFLRTAESDRLHALYVLAVTAGLRQGELFGLHWSDIDLTAATVSVNRTLVNISGKLSIGEPKTAKSRRKVRLSPIAVRALQEHRRRSVAEGNAGSEWVFCNEIGKPIQRQNMRKRSFLPLIKAAGVPAIRFHDLRHTSATLLLSAGTHPKVVQERLGHSQIGITLDTYSHVLEGMDEQAAAQMDAILTRRSG